MEKLNKALADLDNAFDNLEIKPLSDAEEGRIKGGNTYGGLCQTNGGVTCNSKCGHTAYWECG